MPWFVAVFDLLAPLLPVWGLLLLLGFLCWSPVSRRHGPVQGPDRSFDDDPPW
jgi:hypothetical protein